MTYMPTVMTSMTVSQALGIRHTLADPTGTKSSAKWPWHTKGMDHYFKTTVIHNIVYVFHFYQKNGSSFANLHSTVYKSSISFHLILKEHARVSLNHDTTLSNMS